MFNAIKRKYSIGVISLAAVFGAGTVCAATLASAHPKAPAKAAVSSNAQKGGGSYVVKGKRYYVLKEASGYNQDGKASYYTEKSNFGSKTASGQTFNDQGMTAASKVLPLGTKVKVTNLKNNKSVVVTINDRGPYVKGRIIDLAQGAAKQIGFQGVTDVNVQTV